MAEKESKRKDAAHANASIRNMESIIEGQMNLPAGSVRLMYPHGRTAPLDSTVDDLRKEWDQI